MLSPGPHSVLVVGSGAENHDQWKDCEVKTLDIEPRCNPDFVGSMTDMGDVGTYDVVLCCHALEHLYPHEVPIALSEFRRVLKDRGIVVIMVPDLEDVKPTDTTLFPAACGPISGLHLFYGDPKQIAEFPHMAHHCGFIQETLTDVLNAAGFKSHVTRASYFNLIGVGIKL